MGLSCVHVCAYETLTMWFFRAILHVGIGVKETFTTWMARIMIMRGTCPRYITMIKLAIITTVDPARTFSDLYLLLCKAKTGCSGHPAKISECS